MKNKTKNKPRAKQQQKKTKQINNHKEFLKKKNNSQ